MDKLRDIIRFGEDQALSQREIAQAVGASVGTVNTVLARSRAAGLSWPLPETLTSADLRAVIHPPSPRPANEGRLEPDWDGILKELSPGDRGYRAPRVTRKQLWQEYREDARAQGLKAYSRSRFLDKLNTLLREGSPRMRFDYRPGEYVFSDFSGKTLHLRTRDGMQAVEILVVLLPCSNLTFACAVPDQSLRSWTGAHRAAFGYFQGVAARLVCDNLKAAVFTWRDGEPHLNGSFAEFARHYGTAVLPARRHRPRDKGAVENAVKIVQNQVLAPLRHDSFFTIEMMNAAIFKQVDDLNHRPLTRDSRSRWECFADSDGTALRPLPDRPWVVTEIFHRKVGPNYHVCFDHNHYSVPSDRLGQKVSVRASDHTVEIFSLDLEERLATHPRVRGRNKYETESVHMPSHHREMKRRAEPGYSQWVYGRLRAVGPATEAWMERNIAGRDFPEQALRSLQGAMRLSEDWPPGDLEAACRAALAAERYGAGFLSDWLKAPRRPETEPPRECLPEHEHIRGSHYFGEGS